MPNYEGLFQMPESFIKSLWPNLNESNYWLKSKPTADYNCVAWAQGMDWDEIDLSLGEDEEPLKYPNLTCLTYIEHYQRIGFELCEDGKFEIGYEKIVLYELKGKTFEHVSRQLSENMWTSKLGEWEDIEHIDPEALQSNHYYGLPTWYMKRKKSE